mgnify:CR=1 FL=1
MKVRKLSRALCLLLTVLMLSGCGSKEISQPTAQTRDDIIMALNAEPSGLDPNMTWDTVTAVAQTAIYETLIAEKNGDSSVLEPMLAESWEISEDGLEITFHLRQGVKFHNGETMTSEDVAFSFNRAIESPKTSVVTSAMDYMEAVDEYTAVLHMKHAYLPILNCLTMATLSVVSKKAVEDCEANGIDFARNPCGTNAYKFVSWDSGEKITLERFDDYWRDPAPVSKFTFRIITDSTTGGFALENGEIDILYAPSRSDAAHLSNLPGITWDSIPGAGFSFVFFNTTDESSPFANKLVRQAVAHALGKEDIMISAVEGLGTLIECPLAPSIEGYDESFKFWEYDLDTAKELLTQAGYPNGFKCSMKVNQQAIYTKAAEAIQGQLREIGIEMEIETMERGAYLSDVFGDMNYTISTSLSNASVPDADFELYRRYHSGTIGHSMNITGSVNSEVDEWLTQARYSLDQDERNELYSKVFEWVKDECQCIPMYTANMNLAFNSDLRNVYAHPVNKYFAYYYSWAD